MHGPPAYQIVAMILAMALSACVSKQALRREPALAQIAVEPGQRRGIIECEADHPCGALASAGVDTVPTPVSANDVAVRFLKVDANGRRWALPNESALAAGEKFAIHIEARRDAHVYLWHRDPQGRLTELLGPSGVLGSRDCSRSNRLRAGQLVQLPAPGAHYTMDAGSGTERIQPYVSPSPLCGPGNPQTRSLRADIGSDCSEASGHCGKVFLIHHLMST